MKLTIRYKFVALMMLMGLLPLLVVLAISVQGGSRLRIESTGENFIALARSRAERVGIILQKDTEIYKSTLQQEGVVRELTKTPPVLKSPEQLKDLDERWPNLPDDSPLLQGVINNPIGHILQDLCRNDSDCREILLTDSVGQLVAATNKTEDYYQAGETWWQKSYNEGKGRYYITPVDFDSSAQSWAIGICLPIYAKPVIESDVVGVVRAEIDLESWMGQSIASIAGMGVQALMVDDTGTVLYGEGLVPKSTRIDDFAAHLSRRGEAGWYVGQGKLRAYAPVKVLENVPTGGLHVETPRWYLLVQADASQTLGPIYRLSLYIALVGLGMTLVIFGTGLYAATRNLIRPLERLRVAADHVAAGDLSHQVTGYRHRFGAGDEIGQLVDNFNRMILAVRSSQSALEQANEMKSRFIRIAGHELRTPISYIIGMTDLLMLKSNDPELHDALGKVRNRAQRLDQIITEMFKALPAQTGMVNYTTFSMPGAVEEVLTELRPFAEGRKQRIESEVQGPPPDITADRDKVHDVLVGLITNAIKFTPDSGRILISTGMRGHDFMTVSIADECGGIGHDEMAHLFEPFYGGRNVLEHSSGLFGYQKRGTGLGLTIARHFVKIQMGDIEVVNAEGGCMFIMVLPIAPAVGAVSSQDFNI